MCEHHAVTSPASSRWGLTRRTALKLALAAGVVSAPVIVGGRLLVESNGRPWPDAPIYVAVDEDDDATAPLLIVHPDGSSPAIWQELLRVEGLPYARAQSLATLTRDDLRNVAVVIALPGEVRPAQADLLTAYVTAGGGLVVVEPGSELAPLCGLAVGAGVTEGGYLCVRQDAPGGAGIEAGALQFHARLRHYALREATPIAVLCSRDAVATTTPAVTWRRVADGAVVSWCYDLAHSVVLTRQGSPVHANLERDGVEGVRAVDMFTGFVDLDRIHIPQADEQQRLLVNLLHAISAVPLPRFWYFPNNADSLLVLTGDSHNNPAPAVDEVLRTVERFGGTMSVYYTPPPTDTVRRAVRRVRAWLDEQPVVGDLAPPSDVVTPYHAEQWRARGHEFALHPYVEEGLEIGWARYWQQFTGLGYGAFTTTRTHRVLWHGWTETARVQAGYDVRMNLDYYHVGPTFQRRDGSWAFGYFTGSGLPMRFVDAEGRLIDAWQQNTHLVDEQVIAMPWGANFVGTAPDAAVEIGVEQMRRAAAGAYAALGVQCHFDPFAAPGPWTAGARSYLEGLLAHASAHSLPILSAAEWLNFTRARAAVQVGGLRYDPTALQLTLTVRTNSPSSSLSLLLPIQQSTLRLATLQANRKQIPIQPRRVGATLYAVLSISAAETSVEALYSVEPV